METARCVDVEVLVVGGGLSGVAASVSSSRAGASTILVENHGYPGGTSTAGLMSSTTNFYLTRKGHLVARGFAYELLERLRQATDRTSLAKFATVPQIPHDLEALKDALIGLLYESGVRCLFHSTFISCHRHGDHWAVKLQTPSGPLTVNAAAVVDATGDASVIHAAGGDCVVAPGSASLEFRMADVNFERLVEYIVSDPSQYDEYCDVETTISDFRRNWESFGIFHLSHGNGKRTKIVQDAIRKGRYSRKVGIVTGMDAFGMYGLRQTRTAIINTGFVVGDFLDPFFLSEAEIQARRAARIASEFLINEMPRFEDSFLVQTAEEIGIRALRRIQGRYLLTRSEIQAACRFPDSIAVGSERKIGGARFDYGFDIPFRILVPEGVEGMLVASGKTASTDPPGLLRAQVLCMQLGQAAGVGAALSAKRKLLPSVIDTAEVQRELLRQGVYLREAQR